MSCSQRLRAGLCCDVEQVVLLCREFQPLAVELLQSIIDEGICDISMNALDIVGVSSFTPLTSNERHPAHSEAHSSEVFPRSQG